MRNLEKFTATGKKRIFVFFFINENGRFSNTFGKHLHVQAEDGKSTDQHHELEPYEKDYDAGNVMLPHRHRFNVIRNNCARRLRIRKRK